MVVDYLPFSNVRVLIFPHHQQDLPLSHISLQVHPRGVSGVSLRFDFHLPEDRWCGASFYEYWSLELCDVFFTHSHIWLFVFVVLGSKSSLYF